MAGWIASVLVLLAASRLGTAQKTYCNPTVNTCPPVPALGTSISVDFTTSESSLGPYVNQVNGPLTFDQKGNGLTLLIMNEFDFPQAGISKYIFYGRVDVTMRTAPGIGIATSFVLQSDDLDEIQFEWVGADLDRNVTRTNYFSKGCTATYDRGTVFTTVNHTGEYHTYSIDWTPEKVEWLVNGQVMRALTAENADRTVCGRFPQSPMRILVGSWVPGKAAAPAGTIDWAGGLADFSKGPSSTYIRGINVTDTANGVEGAKQYRHRDMSGIAANVVVETSENATTTEVSVVTQTSGFGEGAVGSGSAGPESDGGGKLSSSAITGIIVGFVAAGAIIGGLVLLMFLQRRKKRQRRQSEAGDGLVKDGGVVGGVDMKQELDGSAMSEMDAGPPEPKELDVKEMKLELDTSGRDDTDVVSPLSPDTTGDTLVAPENVQKKEEEFYELPGDTPQRSKENE